MQLTIPQIRDYQKCPMLFKFRWIDKIDVSVSSQYRVPNQWHLVEQYDTAIHHVVFGIFHQLADGKFPNGYYVKKRWGKIWNSNRTKQDVLSDTGNYVMDHQNKHKQLERRGLNALLSLHSDFQNGPGTPILIGKEFVLRIGKHEVRGVIDLVREVHEDKKPIIELMDFKVGNKFTILHVKGDMEVTAASMAFQKLFDFKEHRIAFYDVITKKQAYTSRTEKDYKLLELTINQVAHAIEQEVFYPVLNSRCFECPFQKHCEKKEWFS